MSETTSEQIERLAIERNTWQDRAYTAEKRVRGLEAERQRLAARVDDLLSKPAQIQTHGARVERLRLEMENAILLAKQSFIERRIAKALGHKVDCAFLVGGECNCSCDAGPIHALLAQEQAQVAKESEVSNG